MAESVSCLELSESVQSLLFAIRSAQYWEESVLSPSHIYWDAGFRAAGSDGVPKDATKSDVLRWLCIHHADGLSRIESVVEEISRNVVQFHPSITRLSTQFGIASPTHHANYHHFALAWLNDYIETWRQSWSTCLKGLFPYIRERDPREDFHHVDYSDDSPCSLCYPWSQLKQAADQTPPELWTALTHGYGLFNRAQARQDFPFDSFVREANCLKQLLGDSPETEHDEARSGRVGDLPPQYDSWQDLDLDEWIYNTKPRKTWPELIAELALIGPAKGWPAITTEVRLRERLVRYSNLPGKTYPESKKGNPNNRRKSEAKKVVNPKRKPKPKV
ncbi:hypothetical protein LF1_48750 [Rubripirellula obstinata]|uniref:Uncharacterized protein n=1 Tax=Rubripirellula obstinata TaxID=406547 RepID=A0A5B1CQ00_9BACT|nr:hypothetical protein [Rubripirellula obstinata]KAA1262311.1 hypothetical protein LF1_48750 [Rubripirellula obstinata]